ncbi:hypothetical protein BHM03_00026148 [Ensete ventricosum]|nr:hypothetical protein BHM03_00026148 [Ensete ventricosum]
MGNCFSGGGQGGRLVGGAAAAAGGAGLKSGADGAVNLFLKSGCLRSPYTQIEVGISIRIPHRKTLDSSSVVPFVLVPEFRDLGRCGFHWAVMEMLEFSGLSSPCLLQTCVMRMCFQRFFFSLLFFLPPSADTAGNWLSTVKIDRYRPTAVGNGRNRPLPVDFGCDCSCCLFTGSRCMMLSQSFTMYLQSYLQSSYVICSKRFASMQMLKLEEQQLLGEASSVLSEVWHLITSECSRGLSMVYIRYSLETFLSHHCFC